VEKERRKQSEAAELLETLRAQRAAL
jgi:hypothetical protein